MSGAVRLLREPLGIWDDDHIVSMKPWIRPNGPELYWHYVRSAASQELGLVKVSCWCGFSRQLSDVEAWTTDTPPLEMRCGTCAGRAGGFHQDSGLIFRPRDCFSLPSLCPGWFDPEHLAPVCRWCSGKKRHRYRYGYIDIKEHSTGPTLEAIATPCPRHGWKYVTCSENQLICRGPGRTSYAEKCGFVSVPSPTGTEQKA